MRQLLLLSACVMACAALLFADDKKDDKPTVEIVKLTVEHKVDEKVADQFEFGLHQRTEVGLLVRSAGKSLIGLRPASKVTALKDDKGNSLFSKALTDREKKITWDVALDRSALLVSVVGRESPGKGATRVRIEGELILVHGTQEKKEEKEKFSFSLKSKAKLGKFDLLVRRTKSFRGGPEIEVTSESLASNVVKGVTVEDGDGKAVEVVPERDLGIGKWAARFSLRAPLKEGKVVVTYFSKEEEVKVPLDLSVGLAD